MWKRTWKVLSYRPKAPRRLLLRFTIPVFIAVLFFALLLGAAPFWAAVAGSGSAILTEPVIDAVWVRRIRSVSDQHR
ncbi:MAG: hypothetical protein JO262_05510 [Solirubrobacterales bacterium]|nr:hypothetical protein [Solirubrobacterales bacterium]